MQLSEHPSSTEELDIVFFSCFVLCGITPLHGVTSAPEQTINKLNCFGEPRPNAALRGEKIKSTIAQSLFIPVNLLRDMW